MCFRTVIMKSRRLLRTAGIKTELKTAGRRSGAREHSRETTLLLRFMCMRHHRSTQTFPVIIKTLCIFVSVCVKVCVYVGLCSEIGDENKGRQMLEKMGWKRGEGLGKDGTGRKDPVRNHLSVLVVVGCQMHSCFGLYSNLFLCVCVVDPAAVA